MQTDKITVERESLANIVSAMEKGQLRIPKFQREFVWERSRVQALLDSMLNEYPIGTLFFWKAPSEYNHMIRDSEELQQPPKQDGTEYTLILDGQQRLTSLYSVVKGLTVEGEDFRKIVFDLMGAADGKLAFQYREPDGQRFISVKELLAYDPFPIYNSLPNDEFKRSFNDARALLAKYPFSVVTVSEMKLDDAIEIFERINQQGRRLSRYDLIAASVLTDTFDLRERTDRDLNDTLADGKFGRIPETNIPQSLALNLKGNTEYTTQLNLTSNDVERIWRRTVDCLLLSVEFLRKNVSALRVDMLPYDGILAVLQHYFYKANSNAVLSPQHQRELERWFWIVTFSERYSGASQTRMSEDARWIGDLVSKHQAYAGQGLIDQYAILNTSMRHTTSSTRNGFLCVLSRRRPLHFENGGEISLVGEHFTRFTSAEKHHIFPAAFLKKIGATRSVHTLPNFCYIPSDLNRKIEDSQPSIYFGRIRQMWDEEQFRRVMQSHLIPVDESSGIWSDDFELFSKQRSKLIMDEIRLLSGMASEIPEESRDPVVDKMETSLRDVIDNTLSNTYGLEYWTHKVIPNDLIQKASLRIDQHVAKSAGSSKLAYSSSRSKLDFMDVSDYAKIITSNWQEFSNIFKSGKGEVERNILDFKDYRNAVKHTRQIDSIVHLRGNAAILWLAATLDVDLSEYGISS